MKQVLIGILFLCSVWQSKAVELRSIELGSTKLYYYFSRSAWPSSRGLLVFMHGSVSQYMNKTVSDSVPLATLLENSKTFVPYCYQDGFDLIVPIAYNNYNWLDMQGKVFIDTLVSLYKDRYEKTILTGFSDGGTGAYKYFYTTPERYDHIVIYNGYPQHQNFYKTVDYLKVTNKTVVFVSQKKDKVVPYEFLLREYRRQKMVNGGTYFILTKGNHRFDQYTINDFIEGILVGPYRHKLEDTSLLTVYPPIDGFMEQYTVRELYKFRRSAVKKYGMSKAEYERKDYDHARFRKILKRNTYLYFYANAIKKDDLMNYDTIEFHYEYKHVMYTIRLNNYFRMKAF